MTWCLPGCQENLLAVPGLETPPLSTRGDDRMGGDRVFSFEHVPVMPEEVIHYLEPRPGKTILDSTLGGAGHAEKILQAGAALIGLDQDPNALSHAEERLKEYGNAVVLRQINFAQMLNVGREICPEGVDGILMDLGVSSHQLDCAERGFSLRTEGPLDMRMNPAEGVDAAEVINGWEEADLARIFWELGEERKSRAIAGAIVRRRVVKPFTDTLDLADCVSRIAGRRGRIHPATRVFQALRMTVNREMECLEAALESAPALLKPGGRIAVITFHSLEDRMVKRFFKSRSQPEIDRPEWPAARSNPDFCMSRVTRRPAIPGSEEVRTNPRSRSAKLRVAEKRKVVVS
tara:strand:+ start:2874 stop:3914 length:1041 start_codon:yes stop_codon:yes gene_type:complete